MSSAPKLAPSDGSVRSPERADPQTHEEMREFLDLEAELIDDRRFHDWLGLVSEEFVYRMPIPFTPDNPSGLHYDPEAFVIDETRDTLEDHWFSRYEPEMWEMAWGENPPVRFRHFITNVRVRLTRDADVFDVRSNALISATRQSDQPNFLVIERLDKIRRSSDDLQLCSRLAVSDSTVLEFVQLRVVF